MLPPLLPYWRSAPVELKDEAKTLFLPTPEYLSCLAYPDIDE